MGEGGRLARRTAALLAAGVLATAATSAAQRTRPEVQEWDCPPAPASCARPVLVGGLPLAYVSDHHGISVVGRVGLLGALLGEDRFHPGAFWMDVAVWTLVAWSASRIGAHGRRRAPLAPAGRTRHG